VRAFDAWHYINLPNPDDSREAVPPRPENVIWAIEQATSTLRGDGGDFAKAMMLRFLLHFVGDIHQPLHCVNRRTAAKPKGDRGGNDFELDHAHRQLHAYWDHGGDALPAFDHGDWRALVRPLAREVVRAVPESAVPEWTDGDPETWAKESLALAYGVVYVGIQEGARPGPEYAARVHEVVRRRLAVGGYRLAALLNGLFDAVQ
ncbi:MAG: hypothetical protein GY953_32015, partial [bacterium]|nr:hypothetical protein [bacterium]